MGVVIPAYNEEPFVRETIETIPDFVDRIYVVDDESTDDTWNEIVAAVRAERERGGDATDRDSPFDSRIVAIQHEENRGVGGAIKTGYLRARGDGIAATAVMGGDGQMDPSVLGDLFDPIVDGEADYVKGNRFAGPRDSGDMPSHRVFGNAVLNALTKIASGYWNSGDPQSGYTAISLRALEEANIEEMYEFYGYCNDLLVKLNVAGMRVLDIPNPIIYGDEESHIKYRTYVPRVSGMLLRNFLWRLKTNYLAYDFHPLVVAYGVGAVAGVAGLLGFVWALPGVGEAGGVVLRGALASIVLLLGVLSLVGAMVMDMRANEGLSELRDSSRGALPADATLASERGRTDAETTSDSGVDAATASTATSTAVESDGGRDEPTVRTVAAEAEPSSRIDGSPTRPSVSDSGDESGASSRPAEE